MMVERVLILSLKGGYVAPWSHCASWSCQRTHHHYTGHLFSMLLYLSELAKLPPNTGEGLVGGRSDG